MKITISRTSELSSSGELVLRADDVLDLDELTTSERESEAFPRIVASFLECSADRQKVAMSRLATIAGSALCVAVKIPEGAISIDELDEIAKLGPSEQDLELLEGAINEQAKRNKQRPST